MSLDRDRLLAGTDLSGTLVFAVEGSMAGAAARLDVFGVLVIGFVTAVGGGLIRDLLLGETPPAALRSGVYVGVILLGSAIVIGIYGLVNKIPDRVLTTLDAFGLALFAVTGALKAVDKKLHLLPVVMLGVISACGGGVIRDVLLNRVPVVLTAHIYAVAAALGAALTVLLLKAGSSRAVALGVGIAACAGLRIISVEFDWNLPRVID